MTAVPSGGHRRAAICLLLGLDIFYFFFFNFFLCFLNFFFGVIFLYAFNFIFKDLFFIHIIAVHWVGLHGFYELQPLSEPHIQHSTSLKPQCPH